MKEQFIPWDGKPNTGLYVAVFAGDQRFVSQRFVKVKHYRTRLDGWVDVILDGGYEGSPTSLDQASRVARDSVFMRASEGVCLEKPPAVPKVVKPTKFTQTQRKVLTEMLHKTLQDMSEETWRDEFGVTHVENLEADKFIQVFLERIS